MHSHTKVIAAMAALLTSTMALPTTSPSQSIQARDLHLQERGATDTYGDYTGQWSSYADGSGTYVRSDDSHRYASGVKCWTDLFYVRSEIVAEEWKRNGGTDCKTSSECELGVENNVETCTTWDLSVEIGAEMSVVKDVLSVSGSVTSSVGGSTCTSIASDSVCHWEDAGKHAVWTANIVKVNHGYIRRRCDYHDGKGDQTVWSRDYDIREQAQGLNVGCAAGFDDTSYPA